MVPTEPVSSFSSPKPHSDTEHLLHHNGQLPNPVFWLSGNKLELRPRGLESHNCTIFLQHQTLQLTKVKFVEEENSLPKCVSFTINMVQNGALCEITAMVPGNKIRACLGFVTFITSPMPLSACKRMWWCLRQNHRCCAQQSGPASRVPKQEYWWRLFDCGRRLQQTIPTRYRIYP